MSSCLEMLRRGLLPGLLGLAVGLPIGVGAQTVDLPDWKPGDKRKYLVKERLTGLPKEELATEVVSVDAQVIVVDVNGYKAKMSREFNDRDTPSHTNTELRLLSFPLAVGKMWSFKTDFHNKAFNTTGSESADVKVTAIEKVQTPAGEFDAYKIESAGFWTNNRGRTGRLVRTLWFAPTVRTVVRYEVDNSIDRLVMEVTEIRLAQ